MNSESIIFDGSIENELDIGKNDQNIHDSQRKSSKRNIFNIDESMEEEKEVVKNKIPNSKISSVSLYEKFNLFIQNQ